MIIEKENNEISVRISSDLSTSKIQSVIDYLRYLELSLKSNSNPKELNSLLKKVKKDRWNKIKGELGFEA